LKRMLKAGAVVLLTLTAAVAGYGAYGYRDAVAQSDQFALRANGLLANDRGPDALGDGRLRQLIMVQDPGFHGHNGVDLSTSGAGLTTISQSLSKRLGFDAFRPGIGKVRQTGFAMGLESRLSKDQILTLFLETVEMGRGPDGWMTGFFEASQTIYGRAPSELSDTEFHRLLAVMISPGQFRLLEDDPALNERAARIAKLVSDDCEPSSHSDVWLEGCT